MAVRHLDLQAAKDQQAEYFGHESSLILDLDVDGVKEEFEIPHPNMKSEEQIKAFNKLHKEFETCDREPPTPVKVTMSDGSTMTTEPEKGPFIEPRRKDGELVDPPWEVAVCIALWGEDKARRFIAAGGPPGLVELTWSRMNDEFKKRMAKDPK